MIPEHPGFWILCQNSELSRYQLGNGCAIPGTSLGVASPFILFSILSYHIVIHKSYCMFISFTPYTTLPIKPSCVLACDLRPSELLEVLRIVHIKTCPGWLFELFWALSKYSYKDTHSLIIK
jgi:hypothetical protein